jgi:hypothetical protein
MSSHFGNWNPEYSKSNFKGQNPLGWNFFYIIGKLLEHRCLKWVPMTHLASWNISYGQKKGRESNCPFDSRPLEVRNRSNFLLCMWCVTYCWKGLNEGYKFSLDLTSIGGLHIKLWAKVPILGISGLPLGSLGTKWHLGVGPVVRHKVYCKGEGGGFPKSRPWWVLWVRVCSWLIRALKVFKLCVNQLVWFVQVHVSNWCLSLFLVPISDL